MSREHIDKADPRIQAALGELQGCITERFPTASFAVTQGVGDDPEGIYLTTTVDLDDPDEVLDSVMERLLRIEVDEGLPVYVLPIRTPERIAADMAARSQRKQPSSSPLW